MQDILIIFKDNEHYGLCLMATDSNHSETSFKNPKMSFLPKDKVAHSTRKGVVFLRMVCDDLKSVYGCPCWGYGFLPWKKLCVLYIFFLGYDVSF